MIFQGGPLPGARGERADPPTRPRAGLFGGISHIP